MADRDEVRVQRQGAGRELQVGGTSASWYQPGRLLTGSVWDALGLPIVLATSPSPRVLILGLGGGSAARLIRAASPSATIIGVELSSEVISAARDAMDLDALALEVHIEDAASFVNRPGEYDLIVEDCFVGGDDGLAKAPWVLDGGLDRLRERLAPGGVLACDTIQESPEAKRALDARFRSLVRVELLECVNHVYVATDRPLDARELRRRVAAHPVFADALGNLRFRTVRSG